MSYEDNPHKYGAPTRAQRASTVCITVRLYEEDADTVQLHVTRSGFSRAELIREAMRRAGLFSDQWVKFEKQELPGSTSENVTIRLTKPEAMAVDRHVRRLEVKRAQLVRGAMQQMGLFGRAPIDMEA